MRFGGVLRIQQLRQRRVLLDKFLILLSGRQCPQAPYDGGLERRMRRVLLDDPRVQLTGQIVLPGPIGQLPGQRQRITGHHAIRLGRRLQSADRLSRLIQRRL
jgi:hypothetical protein